MPRICVNNISFLKLSLIYVVIIINFEDLYIIEIITF